MDEVLEAISIGLIVACFLLNTNRILKSIEICKECLVILRHNVGVKDDIVAKLLYKLIYMILSRAYRAINDNTNALKDVEEILQIYRAECKLSFKLAETYFHQNKYVKARELLEKALLISIEIGDKKGQSSCHANLGTVYKSVGEYEKAREHIEKSLAIYKEIGDRNGKAFCYENLANVYQSVGEYGKAIEHIEKSLTIRTEIGDRNGEACCCANLGNMCHSVHEYDKGREYLEKSLTIFTEIGYRKGEAFCYENLGDVYQSVGEYEKAREHIEKSLMIRAEIGDKKGEAYCYAMLGVLCSSVSEYEKEREYIEKSLMIYTELGDRRGEAYCFENLGGVYRSFGEYDMARELIEKSLKIFTEIGDRRKEASCYQSLGVLCGSVGEDDKAIKYLEEALARKKNIGDITDVIEARAFLAVGFHNIGRIPKAMECSKEALFFASKIGDRFLKATSLYVRGNIFCSLHNYSEAKECCEEAITISREIGERFLETACFITLGNVLFQEGEYVKAEEYYRKSLAISEDIRTARLQYVSLEALARLKLQEGKNEEATSYLLASIDKCEKMRDSLRENDQWKISFLEGMISPYRRLCTLLCESKNPKPALHVSERGRARALADLMSAQYSVKNRLSANPQTGTDIESIMESELNCSCLYVSYSPGSIYFWILKGGGVTLFREIKGSEIIAYEGTIKNLDDFFASERFRSFGKLAYEINKDESLNTAQGKSSSWNEGFRIEDESSNDLGPQMDLSLCYKLIIAPVGDLLESPEIIIVPDRSLYNIPFAALPDESGKPLTENFKIRVAPSITTLRLIHDSPADYHSQTGALIVGNPEVGEVIFNGRLTSISRLPYAEEEAKMVGRKLGVEPLLGQQATKQAVLQAMESVALIHLAAHGDKERGGIALAPSFSKPNCTPREGLYLLTMCDISKVQLRAKLVVLSCCHSARGQINTEGAVGIARAFLGSGARSVLVSLWALEDSSTAQLMSHFYDHLVRGESASDSLHQAMKWMRFNGYSDVKQWAPFILIGDNVTFNFEK